MLTRHEINKWSQSKPNDVASIFQAPVSAPDTGRPDLRLLGMSPTSFGLDEN